MIVVGIDVGGPRKGFHAVALRDGHYYCQFSATDPADIAEWCKKLGTQIIAVDAPCKWSGGRSSETGVIH